MPVGGVRPGAGRKKGVPNKKTAALQAAVAESGMTPLEFMLRVMRDESQPFDIRHDAAKAAAPYVHSRLAAVEHSGRMTLSHEDALEQLVGS